MLLRYHRNEALYCIGDGHPADTNITKLKDTLQLSLRVRRKFQIIEYAPTVTVVTCSLTNLSPVLNPPWEAFVACTAPHAAIFIGFNIRHVNFRSTVMNRRYSCDLSPKVILTAELSLSTTGTFVSVVVSRLLLNMKATSINL